MKQANKQKKDQKTKKMRPGEKITLEQKWLKSQN